MTFSRVTTLAVAATTMLLIPTLAQADTPATPAADVPQTVLQEIQAQLKPPPPSQRPATREEFEKLLDTRLNKIIELGAAAEEKYPHAGNLYLVRYQMVRAAEYLAEMKDTPAAKKRSLAIAKRLADSKAPAKYRVMPDFLVTRDKVMPNGPEGKSAKDAAKIIGEYLGRYKDTDAVGAATLHAAVMAKDAGLKDLLKEYAAVLEKDYADEPGVKQFLTTVRPFTAKLTRLDGKTLNLPGDLKGKVVVVDFWATWCGPCVAEVPHMVKTYNAYKGKGVQFVGISLDRAGDKKKLEDFVAEHGMAWIQTFSGMGWRDPTARKYGVNAIPSIWVLDSEGNVVSRDARGNLEATIEKALALSEKAKKTQTQPKNSATKESQEK